MKPECKFYEQCGEIMEGKLDVLESQFMDALIATKSELLQRMEGMEKTVYQYMNEFKSMLLNITNKAAAEYIEQRKINDKHNKRILGVENKMHTYLKKK